MAYENLCMYCFEELGGQSTCPHCGRDSHAAVPQIQMLPGTLVYHDRFLIGRALGQDATGIVYAAFDTKRENKLRIREYLPRDCAERLNDGAVVPVAGMEDRFDAGLRKLRASVEGVEDPRKRHFFFEENGTAYIAQRKTAAAAVAESAGAEEPEDNGRRRVLIIAGIAAAVVVIAAIALITLFNGALDQPQDVTENPTLDPNQVWVPSETPTPTPYVAPTFAALVDPDLSWMDYTYKGSVEDDYQTQSGRSTNTVQGRTAVPTAAPTLSGDASGYTTVTTRSNQSEVRALQQKLVTLGWLDYTKISGQYDDATRQAVKDFQNYINSAFFANPKLTVDGIAGPKTQQWLYQVNAVKPTATPQPTPTPTPLVTAAPSDPDVIDANSGANAIGSMQRKLIALGVLPEGADNGSYDATTRAAVKRFQTRVNELQGYRVLEVTGNMDALSMAFLNHYIDEWMKLQTATAVPADAATPTPSPSPTPTSSGDVDTDPNPVNASSSRDAVRVVQNRLIAIGMLPAGSDDGVYGTATASAVAAFQQWVNQQRNEQTLAVSGEADALTRAYLKYCVEHDMKPGATTAPTATPTAAPTDAPTEAPTQAPTAAPTDVPTEAPSEEPNEYIDITIDKNSDKASIRRVQEMLSIVGLISEQGIDGVYGSGTTNAVRTFQQWVNAQGGSLEVTGVVDNATREALEYYSDREITVNGATEAPTEAPTPTPTAEPTQAPTEAPTTEPTFVPYEPDDTVGENVNVSIGPDSPKESIHYAQMMLAAVGALDESAVDGVYGPATERAVAAFQEWVNAQGTRITLEVTGNIDDLTRQALEYGFDHGLHMPVSEATPEATATSAPPADPDDPFNEPDNPTEVPGDIVVDELKKGSIEKLGISINNDAAGDGVIEVTRQNFRVSWEASGDVDSYYVYVSDSAGESIASVEATKDTGFNVDTSRMTPGEVYTVTVGALPVNGGEEDIVWRSARFTLPAPETQAPTAAPTPTPVPVVGEVSAPAIAVAGTLAGDEPIAVSGDSFTISWEAGGDVQSYSVAITDAEGNAIVEQSGMTQTEVSVPASRMRMGVVYTIRVGALPMNGTSENIAWSSAQFMLPVVQTPTPTPEPPPAPTATPEPTPTPAPTVASIGKPTVTIGGTAYQQNGIPYMTDSTIIISWGAEGDVAGYVIYVENQSGERLNLGGTTDTSKTISTANLSAGLYTVYVNAVPAGGTEADAQTGSATFAIPAPTAAPTEAPTPEPEAPAQQQSFNFPISASSDAATIQQLQLRLYQLNVMPGEPEQGVLDRTTLQAVADFQQKVNEQYAAGLNVIDPSNPEAVVDVNTLSWIARGL